MPTQNDDDWTAGECPIWKTPARHLGSKTGTRVSSKRAGGLYRITPEAMGAVDQLSPIEKAKLTTWLVEERRFGTAVPMITDDVVANAKGRGEAGFTEQTERMLTALRELGFARVGMAYSIDKVRNDEHDRNFLMSQMEVADLREFLWIVNYAHERNLIKLDQNYVSIQPDGLIRLEELANKGANTLQAFVAMWFADSMKEAWRLGFAPGIRDAGYEPFRIDNLHHNGKIDDAIVAEIKRSRFLIADFTCGGMDVKGKFQPNPRGGVYYEAGLAHGLGMEVIFTCREDRLEYLHFDTRQFAHIVWKTPADLREQLYNRIAATLKEAPGAPGKGNGSVDPAPDPAPTAPLKLV